MTHRARRSALLPKDGLLREVLVGTRQADLAPILVEQVQEIHDVELHRQPLTANRRKMLAKSDVEAILPRAAAAVALHDLPALIVEAVLAGQESFKRVGLCCVVRPRRARANADANLRGIARV